MEVKKTYIVKTNQGVHKILLETTDGKYFISSHMPGNVYEISGEDVEKLFNN